MTDERKFARFVEEYAAEVPPEAVEEELKLLIMEEKQRMQYDRLTGRDMHLYAQQELDERMAELEAEALHAAKEALVLRRLLAENDFPVSDEELSGEAAAIAARRHTTIEEMRLFFGADFAMLRQELRERKAMAFACAQLPD